MGNRHQAYIIARVRPHGPPGTQPRYRCVAALHDQYSTDVVRSLHRVLLLVSQPENAQIVREELRAIEGKYGAVKDDKPCIPDQPCPFLSFLFVLGWNIDLSSHSKSSSPIVGSRFSQYLLLATENCRNIDNATGVTFIDVTDVENPKYCFCRDNIKLRPRSVEGYAHELYDFDIDDSDDGSIDHRDDEAPVRRKTYEFLLCSEIISRAALKEAFPEKRQAVRPQPVELSEHDSGDPTHDTSSMKDSALEHMLLHSVALSDMSAVEKILQLPGKAQQVVTLLCSLYPTDIPRCAASLLSDAVEQVSKTTSSVDMSGYALEDVHLGDIFSSTKDWASLRSLNLSNSTTVTTLTVRSILTAVPNLQRLVLMNCPAVTNDGLRDLVESSPSLFYRIEALMHPLFLNVAEPPIYPSAFTFFSKCSWHENIGGCTIPLMNLGTIVRALIDFFDCFTPHLFMSSSSEFSQSMFVAQAAFTSATRAPGSDWGKRSVAFVPGLNFDALFGAQAGWAFVTTVKAGWARANSVECSWAFLRLGAAEETPASDGGAVSVFEASAARRPVEAVEIYDLQGFLRAWEGAGVPPAPDAAVRKLESLLGSTNKFGRYIYNLMTREQLVETWKTAIESISPKGHVFELPFYR